QEDLACIRRIARAEQMPNPAGARRACGATPLKDLVVVARQVLALRTAAVTGCEGRRDADPVSWLAEAAGQDPEHPLPSARAGDLVRTLIANAALAEDSWTGITLGVGAARARHGRNGERAREADACRRRRAVWIRRSVAGDCRRRVRDDGRGVEPEDQPLRV